MIENKSPVREAWNLHRNTKKYPGAYPVGFIKKLHKLIGLAGKDVFHVFGGTTQQGLFKNHTNDINPKVSATFHFDARKKFPIKSDNYDVILCDPPYDMEKVHMSSQKGKEIREKLHYGKGMYKTDFVPPYSFIDEAIRICKPGGFICVLHFLVYKQPEKTKRVHLVPIISGPNLRIRVLSIFQKEG